MKTLILTLLFTLSLPVLANSESPMGLFQVDSSHSSIIVSDKNQEISGYVDIQNNLGDSKFILESPEVSFKSHKVTGTLERMEIAGELQIRGEKQPVVLVGNYIGSVRNLYNEQKVAFRFHNGSLKFKIFAGRPAEDTTEIVKIVRDINR